jgi:hypothetical protein
MRPLLLLLLAVLACAPAAGAATPSYNSPGYLGTRVAPPATPTVARTPVRLTTTGHHPDLVVDAAGTAHVAWTEDNGDGADTIRYCRLKRLARTCDQTHDLAWNKAYGTGDGPRFNVSWQGPRLAIVGDQLAVVDYRYPTFQTKPGGACGSCTTLLWVSDDGGRSFTGPAVVGHGNINGANALAFGPSDDPVIGTITSTVTGGTFYQAIRPGRYTTAVTNLGDTGRDQAYDGSLAAAGGKVFAAFADLAGTIHVRRIDGADGAAIGQWSAPASLGTGDYPRLAGGPRGLFLLDRAQLEQDRHTACVRIGSDLQRGRDPSPSRGTRQRAQFGAITQTGAGPAARRLEAVGRRQSAAQGVYLRTSRERPHVGRDRSPIALAPGGRRAGRTSRPPATAAASSSTTSTGGTNSPGTIVANSGFGTLAPTGHAGTRQPRPAAAIRTASATCTPAPLRRRSTSTRPRAASCAARAPTSARIRIGRHR